MTDSLFSADDMQFLLDGYREGRLSSEAFWRLHDIIQDVWTAEAEARNAIPIEEIWLRDQVEAILARRAQTGRWPDRAQETEEERLLREARAILADLKG